MVVGCGGVLFFPSKKIEITPHEIGLVYEDVAFSGEDGVPLHGWFLPARYEGPGPTGTVVFFHGNAGRRVGREADDGSAGFYVQIAPGDSFLGGGFWRPPRGTLARFRAAIAESPKVFQRLATSRVLARRFGGLDREDMLKRMPRGYSEDHPAAEWLRLQSFTVGRALSDAEALSSRLPAKLESDFVAILPLVRWLNSAIDCAPLRRR